jgi:hypothetical protein
LRIFLKNLNVLIGWHRVCAKVHTSARAARNPKKIQVCQYGEALSDWISTGVLRPECLKGDQYYWGTLIGSLNGTFGEGTASEILEPYVIGAVIDLGYCLDLASDTGIEFVKAAHADFLYRERENFRSRNAEEYGRSGFTSA